LFWTGLKDEYKSSEHLFDGKLLIYPLEVNSSWKTDMPFYGSDFYIKLSGTNKVSTVSDIVETPAGNFPHCVRIDFTVTERLNVTGTGLSDVSGVINYWYTPDIGIVKTRLFIKVESIDDNTINESSEVTRILEGYWRIKK